MFSSTSKRAPLMQRLRKSFILHPSHSEPLKNAEEEQPLLPSKENQMGDPESSHELQREGEIHVQIENSNRGHKDSRKYGQNSAPKSSFSSKRLKVSFEDVLSEVVRQQGNKFTGQKSNQPPSSSCSNQPFHGSLAASFQKNSWRRLVSRTKSRLADPAGEQYDGDDQDSDSEASSHGEDDLEDIPDEYKRMKFSLMIVFQWVSLVLILASLLCTISIPIMAKQKLWDLPLWKWEIMILALICGRLFSGWVIRFLVFFIERNFLLRKRVLYFVYGLKKPVQNCLWLGLVLLIWHFVFDGEVKKETNSQVLPYVTKILLCFLVGNLIWLVKTLLVKVLASSFHVNTFFDRIQEALFNQYVIKTLSGPPLFELHTSINEDETSPSKIEEHENKSDTRTYLLPKNEKEIGKGTLPKSPTVGRSKILRDVSKRKDEEVRIDHVHKLNHKYVSAWNMRRMINIISPGQLATLDERILDSDTKDETSLHIKSECQTKEAAKRIFQNVAKPESQYIHLEDVLRFMRREEALKAMHHFGAVCKDEGITKPSLNNWLVNAFRERKALALSLDDTKTAVDELHNMFNIIVAIIIVIIWLIILGIQVNHFLVLISSQLLLVVFIFGNTCKTTFEAIVFLFIMHPFDVGDHCEVDGVLMVVEEMNILTTVFLRHDGQKIIYPNSELASKPVGNIDRSPQMVEQINFCIHISTPAEKIAVMRDKITRYIESKDDCWQKNPMIVVRDVEDMNKLKFIACPIYRTNYHTREKWLRRGLLIEEMIRIFKELDVEYRMLPQEVNVRNLPAPVSNRLPSNWTACAA